MPPASGLIVIAERSATFRVRRVSASVAAPFPRARDIDAEFQEAGAPASAPPITPVMSSFAASSGARRSWRYSLEARREADGPPGQSPRRRSASNGRATRESRVCSRAYSGS